TVSVTGGTAGYTYSWNTTPVQTSATASGLSAGNYTATVTDSKGCVTTASVTITEPGAALSARINKPTEVNCFGGTTGSATVSVTGGTAGYTYSWNTTSVQTSATARGFTLFPYTTLFRSSKGCVTTASVTITEPGAALSASINNPKEQKCEVQTTYDATWSVTGGTAGYSYSWNTTPVQTSATASGLSAGNYTATVTDSKGCVTTASVTIPEPGAALSASINNPTEVNCFGGMTGSATVSVTGGTAGYSYSW